MQALVILLHLALVAVMWYVLADQVKHDMKVDTLISKDTYMVLLWNIKDGAKSLLSINLSALALASVLSASLNGSLSSFSTIEEQVDLFKNYKYESSYIVIAKCVSPLLHFLIYQVAPYMFLAFSIVPHQCQSSYVGENGLLFSYYMESNQTFALFANSSYTSINSQS